MKKTGKFPQSWAKVTCIINLFPTCSFLIKDHGLDPGDIISVRHTRISHSKWKWKNHRTAFKHVYSGTVTGFNDFCRDFYKKKVWKKKKDLGTTQEEIQNE